MAGSPPRRTARWRLCSAAASLLALAATQALGQGQGPAGSPRAFTLPALPAPAGQDVEASPGLHAPIVVTGVRFEGAPGAISEAELQAIAAPFLNRPLRALEVEELRQALTRALIALGLVNSGAVLPERAFADGVLRVHIVQGTVARLRLSGMERLHDDYVTQRLVRPGQPLNVNVLQERFQLLLADPLFARLNARLLPGDEPGRAVLDLDVARARPWSLGLFASNHLAPAVGAAAAGLDGTLRNLTGWGDALSLSAYGSGGTSSGDASFALPLAASTTLATLRLAQTRTSLIEEPVALLDIASRVSTREFSLTHPFVDGARERWSLGLTHALRRNTTTLAGEPFSVVPGEATGTVRIEAWRLVPEMTLRFTRHVFALRASLVQGRNNVGADAPPAAAAVPPPRYRLWQLQGQAALALGEGGEGGNSGEQILLRGQVQRSRDTLVPLEQMAIGGRQSVRGYRENTLVRDNAWSLSGEWHWPFWRDESLRGTARLVPFIDAGAAGNRGERMRRLSAAGLGLVLALGEVEGELFAAHRLNARPVDTSGDLQDHGIHIALRYRWP